MNMKEIGRLTEVRIPANVAVPCPVEGFKPRGVARYCVGCEHFLGMLEVDADPASTFAQRYRVQCGCPVSRRIAAVDL